MKLNSVLLLVMAVGCGLVAMFGVQEVLKGDKSEPEAVSKVLVAKTDISPGSRLDESNVAFKPMPEDSIPAGAVTKAEDFKDQTLRSRAVKGEYIMLAKLGDAGAASDIPAGMRLFTVNVNSEMNQGGLVLPGDFVDVMVSFERNDSRIGRLKDVKTVLEQIEVFGTDGNREISGAATTDPNKSAKNISLLVTQEKAQRLTLADSVGDLHLTLRPKDDDSRVSVSELFNPKSIAGISDEDEDDPKESAQDDDVNKFLDTQNEAPVTEQATATDPEKPKWKIKIYSGNEVRVEEVDFPSAEESVGTSDADVSAAPAKNSWMETISKFLK